MQRWTMEAPSSGERAQAPDVIEPSRHAPLAVWVAGEPSPEMEVATSALRMLYEVRYFESRGALLEALTETRPELLVIGSRLADGSGVELSRFVRRSYDRYELPILFVLGAQPAESTWAAARRAEANAYVEQRGSPLEWLARADALMFARSPHAQRQLEQAPSGSLRGLEGPAGARVIVPRGARAACTSE